MSDQDIISELDAERARKEELLEKLNRVTGIKHEFDESGNLVEVGPDWHIDKYGAVLGFNELQRNEIKSCFDSVCQSYFEWAGADPSVRKDYSLTPDRSSLSSCCRAGDPRGVSGLVFRLVRWVYFRLEFVPILNSARVWYAIDRAVLDRSDSPIAREYLMRFTELVRR